MSRSTQYMYGNTTARQTGLSLYSLGLTSNYSLTSDTADVCSLANKTAPIDALEKITFQSREIPSVASGLNIQNPSPVKSGIQYSVKVEETLRTTDSDDPTFVVDEPIVLTLSVRHKRNGVITSALVGEAFKRLCSAVVKSDGSFRFEDLMRSAERPVTE